MEPQSTDMFWMGIFFCFILTSTNGLPLQENSVEHFGVYPFPRPSQNPRAQVLRASFKESQNPPTHSSYYGHSQSHNPSEITHDRDRTNDGGHGYGYGNHHDPSEHDHEHEHHPKINKHNIQQYITQRDLEKLKRKDATWKTYFAEILAATILVCSVIVFFCWYNFTKRGRERRVSSHSGGTPYREKRRMHRQHTFQRANTMPEISINTTSPAMQKSGTLYPPEPVMTMTRRDSAPQATWRYQTTFDSYLAPPVLV